MSIFKHLHSSNAWQSSYLDKIFSSNWGSTNLTADLDKFVTYPKSGVSVFMEFNQNFSLEAWLPLNIKYFILNINHVNKQIILLRSTLSEPHEQDYIIFNIKNMDEFV